MLPFTIRIDIDGERDIFSDITLSSGDINAYGLILEFFNGGAAYDVTGCALAAYARQEGGSAPIPDVGTITNGKGYYVIKPSMYSHSGALSLEIVLTDTNGMHIVASVLHFTVRSGFSADGGSVVNETDYSVLTKLISEAQAATMNAMNAADYAGSVAVNKVSKTGDIMTGKLEISDGGLVVGSTADTLGENAFVQGKRNIASGYNSSALGSYCTAEGHESHAEGEYTRASGDKSHAEGWDTLAPGEASHAEGFKTSAEGVFAHAEGCETSANGWYSHAEGESTVTEGDASHAEGSYTIARGYYQHVQGRFNIEDTANKYADIVGGGTAGSSGVVRKNISTLDWKGNQQIGGGLTLNMNKEVTSLPPASAEYRGQVLTIYDDTGGDKVYICRYNGAEYEWVEAAIGQGINTIDYYSEIINVPFSDDLTLKVKLDQQVFEAYTVYTFTSVYSGLYSGSEILLSGPDIDIANNAAVADRQGGITLYSGAGENEIFFSPPWFDIEGTLQPGRISFVVNSPFSSDTVSKILSASTIVAKTRRL